MSLSHVRPDFVECPVCIEKPGSPALCRECLERRELYGLLDDLRAAQFSFIDRVLCAVWPPAGYTGAPKRKNQSITELTRICPTCNGTPDPECKEHGR